MATFFLLLIEFEDIIEQIVAISLGEVEFKAMRKRDKGSFATFRFE